MIGHADARHLPLPDGSVDAIVTSPPYFGLRQYGSDGREIGRESLAAYLNDMVDVATELKRVLKDDGLLWFNIGDTSSKSGGAGGDWTKGKRGGAAKWRQGESGLPAMSWCNVPARLSIAFQDVGWLLRSTITWDKGATRPESLKHVRRPGISHEVILMLAKTDSYRFHDERLLERGSVWHFSSARGPNAHLAPFPSELAERCIAVSTEPGDLILDPFAGSGTTLKAAALLGRRSIGFDLYAAVSDSETQVSLRPVHE